LKKQAKNEKEMEYPETKNHSARKLRMALNFGKK